MLSISDGCSKRNETTPAQGLRKLTGLYLSSTSNRQPWVTLSTTKGQLLIELAIGGLLEKPVSIYSSNSVAIELASTPLIPCDHKEYSHSIPSPWV